ncbi:hypothetical protein SAMN05192588_1251 [Nonlabens sp. Hel1_33_55]|uniref:hypothetical protein n=1 Tax=Nonlabens sp. Hel1_33_55 TaxID=1336802 RepID=UPI000875DEA2|nr:hypothetical protein [Nonlabens sp. Hel1_33_55]SCY12169.1 hypothetical protein SAMN05192588_1251 [Nonlabens sp. Hel1_33_55]
MKRIHFANHKRNFWLLVLLLLAVFGGIVGAFELIPFENEKWDNYLVAISSFSNAVFVSHFFWYKNYVQWSKGGMYIKIKKLFGKTVTFKKVMSIGLKENVLCIDQKYEDTIEIDLSHIAEEDRGFLYQLIKERVNCEDVVLQ